MDAIELGDAWMRGQAGGESNGKPADPMLGDGYSWETVDVGCFPNEPSRAPANATSAPVAHTSEESPGRTTAAMAMAQISSTVFAVWLSTVTILLLASLVTRPSLYQVPFAEEPGCCPTCMLETIQVPAGRFCEVVGISLQAAVRLITG